MNMTSFCVVPQTRSVRRRAHCYARRLLTSQDTGGCSAAYGQSASSPVYKINTGKELLGAVNTTKGPLTPLQKVRHCLSTSGAWPNYKSVRYSHPHDAENLLSSPQRVDGLWGPPEVKRPERQAEQLNAKINNARTERTGSDSDRLHLYSGGAWIKSQEPTILSEGLRNFSQALYASAEVIP
jgi:hypothetical protein